MKKICVLIPRLDRCSGMQRIICYMANYWSENKQYKVTICSARKAPAYYELNKNITIHYKTNLTYNNRNIIQRVFGYLVYKGLMEIKNVNALKAIYLPNEKVKELDNYLMHNKFDVVIGTTPELTMLLCLTDYKCKKVGWQHVGYKGYYRAKGINNYGTEHLAKELFKNLDVNVALNKDDKNNYLNHMNINSTVIYNPLTIKPVKTQGLYTSNLIFVGRLAKDSKGLDYLVDILEQLRKLKPNYKCYVLGDGINRKWFVNELNKRKLNNNVILVGEEENVVHYYTKSSIMLNTSRWEGFSLAMIEAMSCGVILVSFENGSSKEMIDNGINGYIVNNFDTKKYANIINDLLNDNEKRKVLSINAIEKAKQVRIEEIAKKWNDIFSS